MPHIPSQVNLKNNKTLESILSNLIRRHPIITATAIILPIFFRAYQLNLYSFGTYLDRTLEVLEIRERPNQPTSQSPQHYQTQPHYPTNSLEHSLAQ